MFPFLHPPCDPDDGPPTPIWGTSALQWDSRDCVGFIMMQAFATQFWNIQSHGVLIFALAALGLGD